MSTPIFSVLVPTYNQACFLPAALDSLLAQTVLEWEALVVDDGSTDGTREILERYAAGDKRIRVFRKHNGGTASALNKGLQHAVGEWVCWLSSDDLFKPDKLAVHLKAIAEHPACRFFHTDYELLFDDTGERVPQRRLPEDLPPESLQRIAFFEENQVNGISIAVRLDLLRQAGPFTVERRNGQDFDLWLRCHRYAASRHIPRITCSTRVHNGQGTVIAPLACVYDSGRSCLEMLDNEPFSALFPLLDVTCTEGALLAVQRVLSIIANPVSIINLCGFGKKLLEKTACWLGADAPDGVLQLLARSLPAIIQSIHDFGCSEELSGGLALLDRSLSEPVIYLSQNWAELLAAHAAWFEKNGRTADAGAVHSYLRREGVIPGQANPVAESEPVDIVFLTYNRTDYFRKTLQSLKAHTRYPYRLIVVDNNSGTEMQQFLDENTGQFAHLILNDENYFTAAFQRGIACALSDPYILCDPDILVPQLDGPCWLERLIGLHLRFPDMGMIALNLDPSNKPAKLPDVYIGEKQPYNEEITLCNVGTVMQSIKRRFFDGRYLTDWETCDEIRKNGGKVGFARTIVAYHLGWDEERDYPEHLLEKHRFFMERYGTDTYLMYTGKKELLDKMKKKAPDYYACSRPDVQEMVSFSSRRILDVGCAAGRLGADLKKRQQAEVWGVEYVADAAALAADELDRVITGSIEEALPQLPDGYFDTIICADVLEHLVNPWQVLLDLRTKLADGGELVASIPNVRHWSVVRGLLEGHWQYCDAGILDRTHLRFFTLEGVGQLFDVAGFELKELYAKNLEVDCSPPETVLAALAAAGLDVASLEENSQHYQYLAKVIPRSIVGQKSTGHDQTNETSAPLLSMVMLTWNQLDYTRSCLASIQRTVSLPFELIVVDNGSTDGTVDWLRQQAELDSRIRLVENRENRGFSAGNNQGVQLTRGRYILLINNDLVFYSQWLEGMLELFERYPDAGIVGPMTDHASGLQVVAEAASLTAEELPVFAERFRERWRGRVIRCRRVVGFCMLFRRELFEQIGLLDESFGSGNYEDDDYCLRAELAGYRNLLAGDVFVHHAGGASFSGNNLDREAANLRNRRIFMQKWNPAALDEPTLRRWLGLSAQEEAERLALRGEIDQASALLVSRGIALNSDWPEPYFRLCSILAAVGRFPEALGVLGEMPEGADRIRRLEIEVSVLVALGDATADLLVQKLLAEQPENSTGWYAQGVLAQRSGDLQQAETCFSRALDVNRFHAEAIAGFGLSLWSAGDRNTAADRIIQAVMLEPCNRRLLPLALEAARSTSQWERLCELLVEGVRLYPHSRATCDALLDAYQESGQLESGLQLLGRMLARFGVADQLLERAARLRRLVVPALVDGENSVSITLCMIVKNEEKQLARCLASAMPVIDQLVVVDTGSTDRTVAIAGAFGAQVLRYEWHNDYASARNFAIEAATGDWILVLDADESLAERDYPLLKEAVQQGRQQAWQVGTRNYTENTASQGWEANDGRYPQEQAADGWYPSLKVRLFPRLPEIRFRGKVHEMVEPALREAGIPIVRAPFVVHHYGELDQLARRSRQQRYYLMGQEKLAEEPENTELIAELALQAGELGYPDQALALWNRLLQLLPGHPEALFNRSHALISLGCYAEARDDAAEALKKMPGHKEAALNLALAELHVGDPELAAGSVEQLYRTHPGWPPLTALRLAIAVMSGNIGTTAECRGELAAGSHDTGGYLTQLGATLSAAGRRDAAARLSSWVREEAENGN